MCNEQDVGDPEWKSAEELFLSNLVPNCKIALYAYLVRERPESIGSLLLSIKQDEEFITLLQKEAKELYEDISLILIVNSSNKKLQQATIDEIKLFLPEFKKYAYRLADRINTR